MAATTEVTAAAASSVALCAARARSSRRGAFAFRAVAAEDGAVEEADDGTRTVDAARLRDEGLREAGRKEVSVGRVVDVDWT